MSRGVWVFRNGEVIPKHLASPLNERHANSAYVIGDSLDYTMNPADGKRYSSKSAYYKAVRKAGCHIVGNEKQTQNLPGLGDPTPDVVEAVKRLKGT